LKSEWFPSTTQSHVVKEKKRKEKEEEEEAYI